MLTRKTLVLLAGACFITALMILVSWSPATVIAQSPTATPQPPVAVLQVLAIPGNAADKNAITATVKYISDTTVGPASTTAGLYTSGLGNVPINVPVVLQVSARDPKNSGTATWALTKPAESKATITGTLTAKFTPDVVGAYYVQVTLKNAAGVTSAPQFAFFNAGTYIGVYTGNCKQCHPNQAAEWAKTGHATVMPLELDNKIDGPHGVAPTAGFITHYSETCTRCHATGWYPAPFNGSGGYWDVKDKAKWTFPTWKQIDEVFTKKAPSNFDAAPAEVKNMANIGCEVCHGPASEHVKNSGKVMQASFSAGVCNQCHAAAANHSIGWQLANSAHSKVDSAAWQVSGPEEQQCVRCHSASGFASFVKNPKNQAAWNNEENALGCAGCHEPHSEANAKQLRIAGKPVEVPYAAKDVGLSAICQTCHNGRRNADDFATGKTTSYPHYSTAGEMLTGVGGITYGANVANSATHGTLGMAPIKNPAYDAAKNPSVAQFLYSSWGDTKGNAPGPCVFCHMTTIISDAKDPNAYKVGGHSFNTVSPDETFDYGLSCKACHGDVKDFDLKQLSAPADYDGNGKVEGAQTEIKGLLGVVWKQLEAKGWKKNNVGGSYADIPANADAKQKNAWFNFRYVYGVMWSADGAGNEGKAAAIHNFKRSVALLQLSVKDMAGSLPAGMAEMK